jgi:hypothetical protein
VLSKWSFRLKRINVMPLTRAKNKSKKSVNKAVGRNIDELFHSPGPRFNKLERKYGKNSKKMQSIRIAAAESAARGGKSYKKKKKGRSPRSYR